MLECSLNIYMEQVIDASSFYFSATLKVNKFTNDKKPKANNCDKSKYNQSIKIVE